MGQVEQVESPDLHGGPCIHCDDCCSDSDSDSDSNSDNCDYTEITVVVAKKGERMLMKRNGEELQATHKILLMESPYERAKQLRQQICAYFGISVHSYLTISTSLEDEVSDYHCLIIVLEIIGDPCHPDEPFEWVDWRKLGSKFKDVCPSPGVARFLDSYLSNKDVGEVNLSLTPWRRVGFFSSFLPLLRDLIDETKLELTDRPEQVHFGSYSTIFEVGTDQGPVFVKIGFKGNGEPRITKAITELFPNDTPKLLAVDDQMEVLLCADHGQSLHNKFIVSTPDKPEMEMYEMKKLFESVMMEWARLQKESVGMCENLIAKGLPVFGRSQIQKAYLELVSYLKENKLDMEYDKIFQMNAYLEEVFDAWEKLKLPNSLVHGDIHNSNVAQPEGLGSNFVFFDWDCAFIGHPFLDLHYDHAAEISLGEDKYLQCWTDYGCLESLKQLVLLTRPVRYLIEAFRDTSKGVWTEGERKGWVSHHLEQVVEALEQVESARVGETTSV